VVSFHHVLASSVTQTPPSPLPLFIFFEFFSRLACALSCGNVAFT
jgi:hypothetical protein